MIDFAKKRAGDEEKIYFAFMINQHNCDHIKTLIENNRDKVDFGPFGKGVSEEWIKKAEERLQVRFPDSYIWWLKNYGGGSVYGDEIFSVYEIDFDSVVGGDIVYMNELNRKQKLSTTDQLVICERNDGAVFYFNMASAHGNEFPVFENVSSKQYAEDFLDFLEKMIGS